MAIKYSIDGGKTWLDAPQGVRVSFEHRDIPGEDGDGDLHVNCTDEGIIMDVWCTKDGEDYNVGTSSEMADEIIARLVEAND